MALYNWISNFNNLKNTVIQKDIISKKEIDDFKEATKGDYCPSYHAADCCDDYDPIESEPECNGDEVTCGNQTFFGVVQQG